MHPTTFGVDISARWFDVAHQAEVRRYSKTPAGIGAGLRWLDAFGGPARVRMEATGAYPFPLATALHGAGHTVLVCKPLSLARYSEALLARTKTDATDARRIARFCEAHAITASSISPVSRSRTPRPLPGGPRLRAFSHLRVRRVRDAGRPGGRTRRSRRPPNCSAPTAPATGGPDRRPGRGGAGGAGRRR